MARPLRKIVRENLFEESLATLFADPIAADEYLAAAEWVLAFDPSIGFPMKEALQSGCCRCSRCRISKYRSTTRSTRLPSGCS